MSGKLFIVSAPSGAGKTSLVDEILTRLRPKCPIDRCVTYTSREIRPGEQEGVDFCYVSPQEFEKRVQEGFFLEWSKEYEHYYGSPRQVENELRNGNSRILVIDRINVPSAQSWLHNPKGKRPRDTCPENMGNSEVKKGHWRRLWKEMDWDTMTGNSNALCSHVLESE